MMLKTRNEVKNEDKWAVEALYKSFAEWEKEYENESLNQESPFEPILKFRGKLGTSSETLKEAINAILKKDRAISKLFTYAHLKHDEDITDDASKKAYSQALSAFNSFKEATSWFEPELLALPDNIVQKYLQDPQLKEFKFYLEKIFRMKPHTLTAEQEHLIALTGKAMSATHRAFSAINDADFKFPPALDHEGKPNELSHGKYSVYLRGKDRILRENAFKNYFNQYGSYENTLAELLSGQIESHVFNAKARGFKSSVEAALFPKNIDTKVYTALIKAVHEEIDALHKYTELRSNILNIKPLHIYDLQVPLTESFDMHIPYDEAEALVIESVAPLGKEYQEILKKGLLEERWVDKYENKNKRSGAYSSGCYDSSPFILMNYKEIIRDLFTLAHEAGHSMHSYLSHKHQPYIYADYSIFVAEVASTFNEELLMQLMLKRAKTKEEKIYLITQKLEDIRGTLFRQTQFAEFELLIHTLAENNVPMTPQKLREEYGKLNKFYYGSALADDKETEVEWARIPHFYYNYYVFQYATGISAALALADKVLNGGEKERDAYLNFLKSGYSDYPIEVLKKAGVDMTEVTPVKQAIAKFRKLTDELRKLQSKA